MAKRRPAGVRSRADADRPVPVVGPREPCPCGSGRRYKACHGREAARQQDAVVLRPFAGLPGECDWIAMRELVPAATAPLSLLGEHAERDVVVATVLPLAWPGLVRADGRVVVGLQVQASSGDASRDVADALLRALTAEPGTPVAHEGLPGPGPRLQDLVDPSAPFIVSVHEGFEYWLDGMTDVGAEVRDSLERANAAAVPTQRLTGVEAAYWARVRDKEHLRWVLPEAEEPLLDALARMHGDGGLTLTEGTRFLGTFRAHGRLCPVWDLPFDTPAGSLEEPAASFRARLDAALAADGALTAEQRHARAGIQSRQLTLR